MLITVVQKAAPAAGAATAKLKTIRVDHGASTDPDHAYYQAYRYTSSGDAAADTGATVLSKHFGTVHDDTVDLVVGTAYWYRIASVDIYGNESAKSTAVTTTYKLVADADADQSPPNIPSVVLASYTGDADNDGAIDTGLTITVTPGAVDSTHPKAVSYICRLYKSATSGGTYVLHKRYPMPETVLEVEVPQKWFYKAEVRAVSFSGAMSALSVQPVGATGVQPAQYLGSIPTPSAPTVVPVANGMAISWPAAAYSTHKETILFVGGVEVWRGAGTKFTDTTIRTAGTSYTYTLQNVDKQDRVGTVSSGTAATYKRVQATDTDQTALAAPASVPVLTQANQDIDGDGSTDIAISAAYTAVTGAVSHELEISTCATVGGTYVVREIIPATVSLAKVFDALTTLYYKVRSRAIGFNGTPGLWSGLSTALKPVKPANTVPTVGAPTVVSFAGFNRVMAPTVAISNLKKYNVYCYIGASSTPGSAVLVGSTTPGIPFDDARTLLVAGNTCWYYLTGVDSWDNESAAKSTGASVVYRIIERDDVAPKAIFPSKIFPRDYTNQIIDTEMVDDEAWEVVAGGGGLTRIANSVFGPSRYMMKTSGSTELKIGSTIDIPVEGGEAYYFGFWAGPTGTLTPGAINVSMSIKMEWYSTDIYGEPTVLISSTIPAIVGFKNVTQEYLYEALAPAGAQVARIIGGATYAGAFDFYMSSPVVRRMMSSTDYVGGSVGNLAIADDAVTTAKVADNAINEMFSGTSNSAVSCTAGVVTTVQSVTCNHGTGCNLVELFGSVRNQVGTGAKDADITIETSGGTVIASLPNYNLPANGYAHIHGFVAMPAGSSTGYRLRVNPTVTGNFTNTRLYAVARRR